MAEKRTVEVIRSIGMDTCRLNDGKIKSKATLIFESGLQYAESYFGFGDKFEGFCVGDKVFATMGGRTVVQVQKA